MDAAADYAAAKALLTRPLPAYVSYTVHSHVKFDAIVRDRTSTIVVRTADGAVVKGNVPDSPPAEIHVGRNGDSGMEPVKHSAFKPACYTAASARMQSYEGRNLEAIALHGLCADEKGAKGEKDFDTLYVDPRTHDPVAAVGIGSDQQVAVRVVQQFARVGDRALPSSLYIRIQGSGLMFWLDVLVDQRYEGYRFSTTEP